MAPPTHRGQVSAHRPGSEQPGLATAGPPGGDPAHYGASVWSGSETMTYEVLIRFLADFQLSVGLPISCHSAATLFVRMASATSTDTPPSNAGASTPHGVSVSSHADGANVCDAVLSARSLWSSSSRALSFAGFVDLLLRAAVSGAAEAGALSPIDLMPLSVEGKASIEGPRFARLSTCFVAALAVKELAHRLVQGCSVPAYARSGNAEAARGGVLFARADTALSHALRSMRGVYCEVCGLCLWLW